MQTFDRQNLKLLRSALDTALGQIGKEYGVQFKLGNGRFSPTTYRVTLTAAPVQPGDAPVVDPEKAKWQMHCGIFGLKASDFGREFTDPAGRVYKIVGVRNHAAKYPIIGEGVQGGRYKFPVEVVKGGLK